MKALMAEAAATATEAAAAEAKAGKIRRKSKELTDQLSDMAAASDAWKSLHGILGSRRGSRDLSVYTDEALLEAFEEIDTDKSGQIDHAELSAAILKMDPKATDKVRHPPGPPHARRRRAPIPSPPQVISDMMKFADADDDGKVDFDEFKKIMLYKPPAEPSGSLPQEKAE